MSDAAPPDPQTASAPHREYAPGAVAALTWGILGLTLLPFIGAVLALVCSGKARQAARLQPGRYDDNLARAGRILGWVGLVPIAIIIAIFSFPSMSAFG